MRRVHPVHVMNAEQRQVAADLWTNPIGLRYKPAAARLLVARKLHPPSPFIITLSGNRYSFYHLPSHGG